MILSLFELNQSNSLGFVTYHTDLISDVFFLLPRHDFMMLKFGPRIDTMRSFFHQGCLLAHCENDCPCLQLKSLSMLDQLYREFQEVLLTILWCVLVHSLLFLILYTTWFSLLSEFDDRFLFNMFLSYRNLGRIPQVSNTCIMLFIII